MLVSDDGWEVADAEGEVLVVGVFDALDDWLPVPHALTTNTDAIAYRVTLTLTTLPILGRRRRLVSKLPPTKDAAFLMGVSLLVPHLQNGEINRHTRITDDRVRIQTLAPLLFLCVRGWDWFP
ncbi:MAG: hypothetical protein WCP28_15290 [Actinomycetes bacterium]